MLEFTHGEHSYRARKLNTFQQMHVLKRVGPVILRLQGLQESIAGGNSAELMFQLSVFLDALHAMTDDEMDFVVKTCAAMVQRQQGSNGTGIWAPILDTRSGLFMFDDIDLGTVFDITGRVLVDNLAGFLPISNPETGPPAAAAPEASNGSHTTTGM